MPVNDSVLWKIKPPAEALKLTIHTIYANMYSPFVEATPKEYFDKQT